MSRFFGFRARFGAPERTSARRSWRLGRRYVVRALVLLGLGALVYYFVGPGGISNPSAHYPHAVSYDQVAGYGDACELFFAETFRDDFASSSTEWVSSDPGRLSFASGGLVVRPAAGESVAALWPTIEYQRGFVCAKIRSPMGVAADAEDSAGVAFWASGPADYYAAVLHRTASTASTAG